MDDTVTEYTALSADSPPAKPVTPADVRVPRVETIGEDMAA
jgi:hypothetical protein